MKRAVWDVSNPVITLDAAMAEAVTLRPALAADLPAMAAVEQSAYPAAVHEGAGVLGAHLSLDPEGAWVACAAGGAVVGYILSHPLPLAACPRRPALPSARASSRRRLSARGTRRAA